MRLRSFKFIYGILFILIILYIFDIRFIIHKNMKLTYWIILFLLLFILGEIVWFEKKKMGFEKLYLLSLIILCVIYIVLFPASTVNDEHYHITMAYHYSNVLLGTDENDEDRSVEYSSTYIRNSDIDLIVRKSYYWGPSERIAGRPDVETYMDIRNNILSKNTGDNELVAGIPGYSKGTNIIEYLPSTLGIVVARVFGMNSYLLLYMAKIFNAITYIVLCYVAISRIPKFKISLALVTMLPVALQEATAISYDCVTNGISFILFAELILIISSTQIKKQNIALIIIYSTILAFCKGGVYIFLVGIGILELFGKKIQLKDKIVGCIILVVNIISVFLLSYYIKNIVIGGKSNKYSISFILEQPIEFIRMCVKTIVSNMSYFIESSMGSYMGWNQKVTPSFVAFGFVIVLLLSTKFYLNTKPIIDKQIKSVNIIVICIEIILIMAALLTDTIIGNDTIFGIQGRYFLPIIPLILILFARNEDENQNKINNYSILKYFISFHIIEIYFLMQLYFSR